MDSPQSARRTPNREITRGIIALYKEYTGRGPEAGKTHIDDDLVSCIFQGSLLPAEQTLVKEGRGITVRQIRRDFQTAMEQPMTDLIETTLGRKVVCLLSDHRPDPDYACEIFVLESAEPVSDAA